jgi:hypothetical protein
MSTRSSSQINLSLLAQLAGSVLACHPDLQLDANSKLDGGMSTPSLRAEKTLPRHTSHDSF